MAAAWEEFLNRPCEQTFAAVCEDQASLVWTICRRVLRHEEDARDAFQSTFARLAALARTPGGLHEPGLSLGRLAAREADALRHRRSRRWRREVPMDEHTDLASSAPAPGEEIARCELRAQLEILTSQLPDRQRLPVQLHHLHGLTHRQIGEALDLEASTVAKRIAKGLAALRRRAERLGLRDALGGLGAGAFVTGFLTPPHGLANSAILWSSAAPAATLTATAGLSLFAKSALAAVALLIGGVAVTTFMHDGEPSGTTVTPVVADHQPAATADEPAPAVPDRSFPVPAIMATDSDAWSSRIEGRVTGEGGNPIGDAVVEAHARGGGETLLAATATDAQGHYRIADVHRSVPAGGNSASILVQARCPGFASAAQELQLHRSAAVQRIDFRLLRRVGGVSGRVIDASGEAVAGAAVRATSASDESTQVRVFADEAGRFAIDALPAGSVALAAAPPEGALEGLGSWPVGTQDIELRLTRRVGVVRGTITGAFTGTPQEGITLQLGHQLQAVTDAQGRFRFDHLPLRGYQIEWAPGGETYGTSLSLTELQPECVWDQPLGEEMPISGLVYDAETSQPVPGVRIRVVGSDPARGGEGVTDDEGRFHFANVFVRSPLRVEVLQGPWMVASASERPNVSSAAGLADLRIPVIACREITALALDPQGHPVEGAQLGLWSEGEETESRFTTDAAGAARVVVPAQTGDIVIVGRHPDWPLMRSAAIPSGQRTAEVLAVPVVDLSVRCESEAGAPVADALVRAEPVEPNDVVVWRPSFDRALPEARAEGHGEATLARLPRIPQRLTAQAPEGLYASAEINLTDAAIASATLTLRHTTVSGRVVEPGGQPIAGAEVFWGAESLPESMEGSPRVTTGPDGQFEIPWHEPKWVEGLSATANGFSEAARVRARPGQTGVEMMLVPGIHVHGRVSRADGLSLAGAKVVRFHASSQIEGLGWEQETFGAEVADGAFDIRWTNRDEVAIPTWLLVLTPDHQVATFDVPAGGPPPQFHDAGVLHLAPGESLRGRVVDDQDRPVADAEVTWEQSEPFSVYPFAPGWAATTDTQGRFTLDTLPRGHWRLLVRSSLAGRQVFEVDVPSRDDLTLRVRGGEGAAVTVQVLDENGAGMAGVATFVEATSGVSPGRTIAHTDAAGNAVHEGVPRGPAEVRVIVGTIDSVDMTLPLSVDEPVERVTVDLREWAAVRGHIESDPPAEHVLVMLTQEVPRIMVHQRLDETGRFERRIPRGRYEYSVSAPDFDRVSRQVEINGDTDLSLTLTPERIASPEARREP